MKRVGQSLSLLVIIGFFLVGAVCPGTTDSLVDEIKSLLDSSNSSAPALAATKADELLTIQDTPANRLLAASAYTKKSNIDLLDLVGEFAGLTENTSTSDFKEIGCIVQLNDPTNQLADLRLAVERLDAIDDTTLALAANKEASFQLGMLQAIEAFVLPTNRGAVPVSVDKSNCGAAVFRVNAETLDSISETDATNVMNDFVNSDDHLREADLENDSEIIAAIFENYCRLKGASANQGFSRNELQAFVWCELDSGTFPAAGFGSVANCAVFSESSGSPNAATITTCKSASDTTTN